MRIKIFAYSFPHWMTRKNFPQPGFWLHLFQVFFFFSIHIFGPRTVEHIHIILQTLALHPRITSSGELTTTDGISTPKAISIPR